MNRVKVSRICACRVLLLGAALFLSTSTYIHENVVGRDIWVPTIGCVGLAIPASRSKPSAHYLSNPGQAGFCLCRGVTVRSARNCELIPHQVNCRTECRPNHASKSMFHMQSQIGDRVICPKGTRTDCAPSDGVDENIKRLFREIREIRNKLALPHKAPCCRSTLSDFVIEGKRLKARTIKAIHRGLEKFIEQAPAYRTGIFKGRGIVVVGGTKKAYAVAYWILIKSIRRVDSSTPIEVWFPEKETPDCTQIEQLAKLQVKVKIFEDLIPRSDRVNGYAYKLLALAYSSFEEVLMLDSDIVVLSSPGHLFDDDVYQQTGTLFWMDFWLPSRAPDLQEIFNMHRSGGDLLKNINATHESGQVLINKRLIWQALTLATYMNDHSSLFYPLSVNYMGLGDKEILPLALTYVGLARGLVRKGPDHVGIMSDKAVVFGNTMLQHDSLGRPQFLHANIGKWTHYVPANFDNYVRRWQVSLGHGKHIIDVLNSRAGIDVEKWVHGQLVELKCLVDIGLPLWYEGLSSGPLLDGMFLTDHFNLNLQLDAFDVLRRRGFP